jgi:XTP/dITP diphosphohydrolase
MKHHFKNQSLVIATHNKGKTQELIELLKDFKLNLISAESLGIIEPEETGTTFEENAILKAMWSYQHTGLASIADDSGLVIPALNGEPGIYSARWSGPNKDFSIAYNKIWQKLGDFTQTPAYFVCALAVVVNLEEIICVRGECFGKIINHAKGDFGFGYDPIFIKDGMSQTFGEIDPILKHKISHRNQAFEKLLKIL